MSDASRVSPEERLSELGVVLPETPPPAAAYVGFVRTGRLVFTAGQVAVERGELLASGRVGEAVDTSTAQRCARQCAINVLSQVRAAVGSLSNVRRVVKLVVLVASTPDFTDQHLVANGASELMQAVFGEAGQHARSALGVAALPLNSPVEVDAIVEIDYDEALVVPDP